MGVEADLPPDALAESALEAGGPRVGLDDGKHRFESVPAESAPRGTPPP